MSKTTTSDAVEKNELIGEVLFQTFGDGFIRAYVFHQWYRKSPPEIGRELNVHDVKRIAERARVAKVSGKPICGDSDLLTLLAYANDMQRNLTERLDKQLASANVCSVEAGE